jgi:hypothetical protein
MKLIPKVYEATYKNVNYKFSYIKEESWSVLKWDVGNPQIPPHMKVLTVAGWQCVLRVEDDTYYRETAWELRMHVESIS